jgi:transposase-like protein
MPLWGTSRLIWEIPVKSVETAQCTLAGIELMHMLRKGQWAMSRWLTTNDEHARELCLSP